MQDAHAGHHHHHHHASGAGSADPLQALLPGASADGTTSQTTTNSDGSTTTTLTYADGTKIDMTTPASSSDASTNSTASSSDALSFASPLKMQAQLAPPTTNLSASGFGQSADRACAAGALREAAARRSESV
jgi:hypothetical protein